MHFIKNQVLPVLFFFFLIPLNCHAKTYSLGRAIDRALEANPSIQEKISALESASMEIGVAQSFFWPRLSLVANKNQLKNSGSVGSTDEISNVSESRGLRASISLFAGLAHLNNLQKSMIEKDIAALRFRQAKLELIANVQIQFFTLLQARRDFRYVKESIKRIESQLKASQTFSDVGMAPYVNVLQNRVELSQANEQFIRTQNTIRSCEIQLNKFLGFPPDVSIVYQGNIEDYPRKKDFKEQEALDIAAKHRADIGIAQKSIHVAEKSALATAGDALPKVDATYDVMTFSRGYEDKRYKDYDRSYWSVGLNFTWTFFEGGKTAFGYARDRKRISGLRAAYENTLLSAKAEVLKALMDIEAAQEVYVTAREGLKSAEESYAMARDRYNENVGTITELIDSQTRLTEAEVRISKSLTDFQIARAKLYYYVGKTNASLM